MTKPLFIIFKVSVVFVDICKNMKEYDINKQKKKSQLLLV